MEKRRGWKMLASCLQRGSSSWQIFAHTWYQIARPMESMEIEAQGPHKSHSDVTAMTRTTIYVKGPPILIFMWRFRSHVGVRSVRLRPALSVAATSAYTDTCSLISCRASPISFCYFPRPSNCESHEVPTSARRSVTKRASRSSRLVLIAFVAQGL